MLAQDTTFGFNVPGSNTTIEISAEGLREILGQVEGELYRSEVYRRALSNLQKMPVKGAESAQFLMKAIGREAIRLTLRHFVQTRETADHGIRGADDREVDEFPVAAFSRALGSRLATLPLPTVEVVETAQASEAITPAFTNSISAVASQFTKGVIAQKAAPKKSHKKRSPADLAEQAAQERQTGLQQIGEQLKVAREARSMSLSQLHSKTMVPMHQLLALESGQGAHLPEDVYLRGFIKRIGTALELDNAKLLDSLPTPDPTQAILPSWYHPQTKSSGIKGLAVQPLHLYVGYAALMAGGLVWLSHQQSPETPPGAIQLDAPNVKLSPQSSQSHSMDSGSSIAPPERF